MRRVGGKASTALFAGGGKRNFIIAFVMRFLLYCLQAIVRLEVYREWNGQRVQCRRLFAIYTYIQEPRNLLSDAWRIYLFFTHWQTILFLCREKIFLQFSFNNILVRKQVNWQVNCMDPASNYTQNTRFNDIGWIAVFCLIWFHRIVGDCNWIYSWIWIEVIFIRKCCIS